jgi:hypothetical protein
VPGTFAGMIEKIELRITKSACNYAKPVIAYFTTTEIWIRLGR